MLLANHPRVIPDAVRQLLAEQDDTEVVGNCRGPMKTLQEVGRTKADVVILVQEGEYEPGLCSQLLSVYLDVTILYFGAGNAAFNGRTAVPASDAEHVRDELLQLLLTSPGERLFLPEFGGGAPVGLRARLGRPAGGVKARITQALSRWLGYRLTAELIDVRFGDKAAVPGTTPELSFDRLTGCLEVTVKYRPASSPDSRIMKFQRTGQ